MATPATRLENAFTRATTENISVTPLSTFAFAVQGNSGKQYLVMVRAGKYTCSCPAGEHGSPCKHIAAVSLFQFPLFGLLQQPYYVQDRLISQAVKRTAAARAAKHIALCVLCAQKADSTLYHSMCCSCSQRVDRVALAVKRVDVRMCGRVN